MINLDRYIEAWKLRQQGKTLGEVGVLMGVTAERVRIMVNRIEFERRRKGKKSRKIELLEHIDKKTGHYFDI